SMLIYSVVFRRQMMVKIGSQVSLSKKYNGDIIKENYNKVKNVSFYHRGYDFLYFTLSLLFVWKRIKQTFPRDISLPFAAICLFVVLLNSSLFFDRTMV